MTAPGAREKVLIVDDEADMCRLLAYTLEEAGFAAEAVGTGSAGLEAAARIRPAVIVLDLMLPDMPGNEVCRRMRATPALGDVGILVLTARGDEIDRVVSFELGADDYVVKPFSVREVVLRVGAITLASCQNVSQGRRSVHTRRRRSPPRPPVSGDLPGLPRRSHIPSVLVAPGMLDTRQANS